MSDAGAAGGADGAGVVGGGVAELEVPKLGMAGFSTWYSCHAPQSMTAPPATYRSNESRAVTLRPPMYPSQSSKVNRANRATIAEIPRMISDVAIGHEIV